MADVYSFEDKIEKEKVRHIKESAKKATADLANQQSEFSFAHTFVDLFNADRPLSPEIPDVFNRRQRRSMMKDAKTMKKWWKKELKSFQLCLALRDLNDQFMITASAFFRLMANSRTPEGRIEIRREHRKTTGNLSSWSFSAGSYIEFVLTDEIHELLVKAVNDYDVKLQYLKDLQELNLEPDEIRSTDITALIQDFD